MGLTDQAIDLFDRLVGAMFRKAEGRHARAFQADARAINEKVRLYARVGAALIAAREGEQDAYGAIATVIPWERFCATVAQVGLSKNTVAGIVKRTRAALAES